MKTEFFILNIGHIIALITVICLAVFVFIKSPQKKGKVTFALMSAAVAVFIISFLIGSNARDPSLSYFAWMFNLADVCIVMFYNHCFMVLLGKDKDKRKEIITVYGAGLLVIALAVLFPRQFMTGVSPKFYVNNYIDGGPLYMLMIAFFFAVVFYVFYEMLSVYKTADKEARKKIKWYLGASLIGYGTGTTGFLLIFDIPMDPILTMFTGFYTVPLAYAMVKHHVLDIEVVVKKALVYAVVIALVSWIIGIVGLLNNILSASIPGLQPWIIPLLSGIAAFFIGRMFWNKSKEVDKLRDEFVTVAAHKFRTPVTRIRWAIDELKDLENSERGKYVIDQIGKAADHMVGLMNLLLEVSEGEKNKYLYTFEPVSLEDLARGVIQENKDLLEANLINFSFTAEPNMPLVTVDKEKIGFVTQTLLENAILYTPRGGKVDVSLRQEKNKIIFSVKDSGIGISESDMPYLFSRFYRAKKAMLTHTEGTGVGLFIAKNIIERHNGEMGAQSEGEGKGSTFWFSLPI